MITFNDVRKSKDPMMYREWLDESKTIEQRGKRKLMLLAYSYGAKAKDIKRILEGPRR